MPLITLPDGSQRSHEKAVTVAEVAASIGAGLARAALAGKVDGQLVDTSYLIQHLIPGIAAPIGACNFHQLEYLEFASGRHMRTATKVSKVTLGI